MKLTPMMEKYVLHWGEMGTRWGVNRTIAQIHAVLFLSSEALHAEEIAETLSIARSNVSTSIKELQSWGLVKLVHVLGDRRDHFESLKDPWEMSFIILEQRKQREIDPTLSVLRECLLEEKHDQETPKDIKARIASVLEFMENMTSWYDQMKNVPRPILNKLVQYGPKVIKFLK